MAGSVVQGIDTLTAAMKSNIVPDQEYLLQGSILDTHLDVLQHRLRGLCDGGEEMVRQCLFLLFLSINLSFSFYNLAKFGINLIV
jgi:hypothetical protein